MVEPQPRRFNIVIIGAGAAGGYWSVTYPCIFVAEHLSAIKKLPERVVDLVESVGRYHVCPNMTKSS